MSCVVVHLVLKPAKEELGLKLGLKSTWFKIIVFQFQAINSLTPVKCCVHTL